MKSLREQFEDDYVAVSKPADNEDKLKIEYIYYAPWYIWYLPETLLKRKKLLLAGISVGSLLIFILSGIQESGVNRYIAVEIAGTFALCAHVFELFSIFQFLFVKYRVTRMTYSAIDRVLTVAPLVRGICLVIAAAAGLYYVIQTALHLPAVLAVAGYLICALMAFYIYAEYHKILIRTEKNDIFEKRG